MSQQNLSTKVGQAKIGDFGDVGDFGSLLKGFLVGLLLENLVLLVLVLVVSVVAFIMAPA